MKRKVALLMAMLMAGSSLSGSYVSAASIEGISEESVQSEEPAPQSEDGGASELTESEIPQENETSGEEIQQAEDQEEDIEFLPEETTVPEEELYAEEEQLIEAEPVQTLMEQGEEETSEEPEEQYSISLDADTNRLYYGKWGSGSLTITADTEGLNGLEDYEINWNVRQYRNDQEEDVSCADVDVAEDGTKCTITVDNDLESEEYFGLGIYVTVMKDGEEVASGEMYIEVMPTETELGGLPQDDTILAGWGYTVNREYTVWRKDASYPNGEDVPVQITQVKVLEDENGILIYDHDDDPDIVLADEEGYYHLNTSRSPEELRYGEAVIEYAYVETASLEDPEHPENYVSGTGSFTISVGDEKYNPGYEYENGEENAWLLPGESMDIATSLSREWYDADEDYEDREYVNEYSLKLEYDDTDLIDVGIIDDTVIRVTAKEENEGEARFLVHYILPDGTEVGNRWISILVRNQFSMITPGYLTDKEERLNPQAGDTLDLAAIEFHTYEYSTENEGKEPVEVEDVKYKVDYDPNVWEQTGGEVDENGFGLPELKRMEGCETAIWVIAYRLEDEEEVARQIYYIEARNYDIWLNTEDPILFYGERSAPVTITPNIRNLEKEELTDYTISYEVEQYRNENEQGEDLTCAKFEKTTGTDGDWSRTLVPEDNFSTEDEIYIKIHASVQRNGVTVSETEMDILVAATETRLDGLPGDRVMLPDDDYEVESEYYIWRRDPEYPDGQDVPVQITGVSVQQNDNDVLDYECTEEDSQTVLADEWGNYNLHAVRDNTQERGGEAVIEYNYAEPASLEDPEHAESYVSGTGTFQIWVQAERYDTGYEYENGKDNTWLLPGASMNITTSLVRRWYDVDGDYHDEEAVEEYTLEPQLNDDGDPDWDSELIDVKVDGKAIQVTAKKEKEGETDIPVRYLIGEAKVGMEWIHISVYNEYCILEPGYLTDDKVERLNPQAGERLNLADIDFQTYECSTENEEKIPVENVKYKVDYDSNAWLDISENVDEDGFGLPELKRISNWGTDITVLAYNTDNEEEIARQDYRFDGYDYAYSYEYCMSGEDLDYGYIYTDNVPLQVTLDVEQELPKNATVEWEAVAYDEEENEIQATWVTLKTDETDPFHVQVNWAESTETEPDKDYSFILRATVSNNGEELFRYEDEWIRVQSEQREFGISYLIYLSDSTGEVKESDEFTDEDWYYLYQQNGTFPKGNTEKVIVTKVEELYDEGEGLLDINVDKETGKIKVTPKDAKEFGDSLVEMDLEYYEKGGSAGSIQIPVHIRETWTQVGEITFDGGSTDAQLIPGQSLEMNIHVRQLRRNGNEYEKVPLTKGEDYTYTVEIHDDGTDIIKYDNGRFYAIRRGDAWVTVHIWDMDDQEIDARDFNVQVTGSYFKAEQGEVDELIVAAGGPSVEIPYSLKKYSISMPDGTDVNPYNVVLESEDEELRISYEDGKIMASLDESAKLEKGENKEAQFELEFLDGKGNIMANMPCTLTLHRHDMEKTEAKEATCTEGGNKAYWTCGTCGKVYADENGKTETTVEKQKLTANGHTMIQTPAQAATCTAEGTQGYWTCQNCHQVFADQAGTTATTIEARKTAKTAHNYGAYTVTKKATALAEGTETHTCTVCGHSESRTIAKLPGAIRLTTRKLPLQLKKSVQLSRIVTGMAEGDYIAGCVSSNTKAATVDNSGKVTGKAAGTAVITIRLASGVTENVTIVVQKKAVATSSITNVQKTWNANVGERKQLYPVISPITTTDKVTYTSSNKKVATVSGKGLITAKKSGTAKITVKSGKKKFTVTVKVAKAAPKGMTGVPASKSLKKNKSFTIKPKLTPAGAEAKITYSSSNKKVAVVNAKGKVTAKGAGTAVITVKAGNVTKTCTVTVK